MKHFRALAERFRHGPEIHDNFLLLRAFTLVYGTVVVLGMGSFLISLFVHDDLMLFKAPRRFEWIAGDLALLLMILWGLLFALSGLWRRNVVGFFCVLLASGIVVLVGWNNWANGNSPWWGILQTAFLFLLPSFTLLFKGAFPTDTPTADATRRERR